MKQASIDLLYKDCPEHWVVLCFNLYLLMLKSRHGLSDISLSDMLHKLADTYPNGNKVHVNMYQAKAMIRPIEMKL